MQIPELAVKIELLIEKVDNEIERSARMEQRLQKLETDYMRYRSFLGGMIFLLTALWAFITTAWHSVRDFFHRLVQ